MRNWMRRAVAAIVIAVGSAVAIANPAYAERRVALVMGNADYGAIGALRNPVNDGKLMAEALEGIGFETSLLLDASQIGMKRAIATFGRTLRAAGPDAIGLFYFAGHGVQANGRNYVMPVEAAPQDSADLDLVAVEVDWVMRQMESAGNASNIIILDACRNNPFATASRSVGRGLAAIKAPTGTFIAYATAPGAVAEDGGGANSPFTVALAAALPRPGIAIEQTFKHVRLKVVQSSGGRQTPWDSSSLVQDIYLGGKAVLEAPKPMANAVETSFWASVQKSEDPARAALFLQLYPDSIYADVAQTRMAELMMRSAGKPPAPIVARTPKPAPKPAPTPVPTALSEADVFEQARQSGSLGDYAAYLARYPDGVFAGLARAEIANLVAAPAKPVEPPPETIIASAPPTTAPPIVAKGLDAPVSGLTAGWAEGKSLRELSTSHPEFSPIEGLDAAAWKDQSCAACHTWSVEELCRQGGFYVKSGAAAVARKQHPFGGPFKTALAAWAKDGCVAEAKQR